MDDVIFTTNSSVAAYYKRAKRIFQNTRWPLASIFMEFRLGTRGNVEQNLYSKFKPTNEIMGKVTEYVRKHNICNNSAMHIRATDMEKLLGTKKAPGNIERRYWFIESLPSKEKVFLLTDSPEIQQRTINTFPKQVLVYQLISNQTEQRPYDVSGGQTVGKNTTLPVDHRFTSLEHTLIDVLIAAHAKDFRGAPYSSLSELVAIYKSIGRERLGWCSDG